MAIPFRGQIDVKDVRRMNRILMAPSVPILVLGSFMALITLWATFASWFQNRTASLEGLGVILFFVLLFGGLYVNALYIAPRKILESSPLLRAPIVGEARESGIRQETAHGHSDVPWDVFLKRKIRKDIVLLYQSIQIINIYPREFFATETDWNAFVDLVRQHVPERAPKDRGGIAGRLPSFMIWSAVVLVIVILLWNFLR